MDDVCGGARDIGAFVHSFRDIGSFQNGQSSGYLPLASSIEYEGLYNELYFDIGRERDKLFAPKYSYCKSEDPFSKEREHYLIVGLASKFDGDGIQIHGRKPFNLVVAIDISGSMSAPLGNADDKRTKMEITANSIISIISILKPGDRFGCVTFNDDVTVVQELELLEKINTSALKQKIMGLKPNGGTALSAALKKSTQLFAEVKKDDASYRASENTIFVMTDLVPTKDASTTTFINTVRKNANERLYTSIIGIGAEFSSDILKQLGKIRACNYYSVHSARDFKQIIDRDFVYILSPIAFNIVLSVNSEQFVVERVYGSPGNEIPSASGAMMNIECVSPSAVDESDKIKGGIVLAKLKPTGTTSSVGGVLKCKLQFEDRNGDVHVDEQEVQVPATDAPNYFNGEAGRKAVLLTRYVNISKHWILDETRRFLASEQEDECDSTSDAVAYEPTITKTTGLVPPPVNQTTGAKKRIPYHVDPHYSTLVSDFVTHYKAETAEIGDTALEPYVLAMQKIADSKAIDCETAEQALEKGHIECLEVLHKPDTKIDVSKYADILKGIAALGKWHLLQKLWNVLKDVDTLNGVLPAIQQAASNGHPKILKQLLNLATEKFKITKENLRESVISTVKEGHLECLQIILAAVPMDVNEGFSQTPLSIAYEYGKTKIAKYLIEKGARGVSLEDLQRDIEPPKSVKSNELDLVFCCDCTGSMGSYLQSAQQSIVNIVKTITEKSECDIRFGLVKYRDHPPQDSSYVTEEHDFTYDMKRMKAYVDTMSASGGGDGPECLVDGMESCLNMDWRPNATRIVCVITDACPHGLDIPIDGFPAGCPCGFDPLDVARKMASKSIVLYSIGVSASGILRDFLTAIAQITEGQYVPLSNATGLSDVIVGGSIEEIDLKQITAKITEELQASKGQGLDEEDALLRVTENLQKQKVQVKQLKLTQGDRDMTGVSIFMGANNLEEALSQIASCGHKFGARDKPSDGKYQVEEKLISMKQVARVWNRLNVNA